MDVALVCIVCGIFFWLLIQVQMSMSCEQFHKRDICPLFDVNVT